MQNRQPDKMISHSDSVLTLGKDHYDERTLEYLAIEADTENSVTIRSSLNFYKLWETNQSSRIILTR